MFTLPLNSHYFHLSCLLTKALNIFYALFIKTPPRHPWKQSPPSGEEKGTQKRVPQSCALHFPSFLLAPLSPSSLLSASLCPSLSRFPSSSFWTLLLSSRERSRTNLAHPTCEGGSSEEHKTIGISGGSKHLGKKH